MDETNTTDLLQTNLDLLTEAEIRKLLTLFMTQQKLGLYWERNQIEHDKALNNDSVFFAFGGRKRQAAVSGRRALSQPDYRRRQF
jgi:hypothetical protein